MIFLVMVVAIGVLSAPAPASASSDLVISQVYPGGGNAGAPYDRDFVELFNRSGTSISLTNHAIQHTSAAGTTWTATAVSGAIASGARYLVAVSSAGAVGASLPTPDSIGLPNMGVTGGKVILTSSTVPLSGACPTSGAVLDTFGYGDTANCFESTPEPAPLVNNLSFKRTPVCTDLDDNANDFLSGTVNPRNSASTPTPCDNPDPPQFSGISPHSPAFTNSPLVKGTATPGHQVTFYADPTCSGPVIGNGSAEEFAAGGITVDVAVNSTTIIRAEVRDPLTNLDSTCASGPTYRSDQVAPQVVIDSGPSGDTTDRRPAFGFHASESGVTYTCSIGMSSSPGPCSGPGDSHKPSADLPFGAGTFTVQATDEAGNVGAIAIRSFNVVQQTTPPPGQGPPDTRITGKPGKKLKVRLKNLRSKVKVSFSFKSIGKSSGFQCKVDKGPFRNCKSPKKFKVKAGRHKFKVRAVGPGGSDSTPARYAFTVKRKPARKH